MTSASVVDVVVCWVFPQAVRISAEAAIASVSIKTVIFFIYEFLSAIA